MPVVAWLTFIAAAVLEVSGDAVIRKGLRGRGLLLIAAGPAAILHYSAW